MADQTRSASEALGLKLTDHRVLIFDVYGTVVDWESAIHDVFFTVFPDMTRKEILANYAEVEGRLQSLFPNTPYSEILELTYRQLSTSLNVTSIDEGNLRKEKRASNVNELEESAASPSLASDTARRFGQSIGDWKPFPDTVDALHRLKKHFALVVLSNVDDKSFAETHKKLCTSDYPGSAFHTIAPDSPFSLILTAQQVGAYKPNPLMLESALRQLSANPDPSLPLADPPVCVDATGVLVVANSIHHDIIPAREHKLRSVWISRYGVNFIGSVGVGGSNYEGAVASEGKYPYSWRYETLGGLTDAVEEEARQKKGRS